MATQKPSSARNLLQVTGIQNTANPLKEISHLDDVLAVNFAEYRVTKNRDGTQTLVGKTHDGQTVKVSQYKGNGIQERSMSTVNKLSIDQRRAQAARLRTEKHLSQQAIADQLGVSQKTISDDLSALGI